MRKATIEALQYCKHYLKEDTWGFAHDVESTAEAFGDFEDKQLYGSWLWIRVGVTEANMIERSTMRPHAMIESILSTYLLYKI